MAGIGGPIRPSGPNGTSDSIMTKKTPKLGKIDQIGQVRIIILTRWNLEMTPLTRLKELAQLHFNLTEVQFSILMIFFMLLV